MVLPGLQDDIRIQIPLCTQASGFETRYTSTRFASFIRTTRVFPCYIFCPSCTILHFLLRSDLDRCKDLISERSGLNGNNSLTRKKTQVYPFAIKFRVKTPLEGIRLRLLTVVCVSLRSVTTE